MTLDAGLAAESLTGRFAALVFRPAAVILLEAFLGGFVPPFLKVPAAILALRAAAFVSRRFLIL